MAAVWFDGICDVLMVKVKRWYDNYEQGQVRGTRKFFAVDGLKDVPTKYLHEIPLSQKEATYLVNIMREFRPKLPLTEMLAPLPQRVRNFPMKVVGTTQVHMVPFAYYKPEVREIVRALEEAKAAAKNTSLPQTVETFVADRKKAGGHLFNIND